MSSGSRNRVVQQRRVLVTSGSGLGYNADLKPHILLKRSERMMCEAPVAARPRALSIFPCTDLTSSQSITKLKSPIARESMAKFPDHRDPLAVQAHFENLRTVELENCLAPIRKCHFEAKKALSDRALVKNQDELKPHTQKQRLIYGLMKFM